MKRTLLAILALAAILTANFATTQVAEAKEPVKIIFDTDMGNDVDDAMALAVVHSLISRGEIELLAVTSTKDNPHVAPMIDAINTFYGRPDIPIGVVKSGVTPDDGNYIAQVSSMKTAGGSLAFPRDVTPQTPLPDAVSLIRKTLAAQDDGSVVIVQIGFFTNLQRLIESDADEFSPLTGVELVKKKVTYVSLMAGAFAAPYIEHKEYNVVCDLAASHKMIAAWPTPMIFSGFEIGILVSYPPASIQEDYEYVPLHPVKEAYRLYIGLDKWQPTFDLNSVLYAARPQRDYYTLSEPGTVTFTEDGATQFTPSTGGKHRYQILDERQKAAVTEALVQLCSQPPVK